MESPVSINVNEASGSVPKPEGAVADNAPAKSSDNIVDGAPTTHINEMPCNRVTQSPAPNPLD
jgi:hypothetical protein